MQPQVHQHHPHSNRTNGYQPTNNLSSDYTGRSDPSYAYTSSKNAPKYSPIRNARPGANNVPMSYAGPPTQAEINRNLGRLHHTNAYAQNPYGPVHQQYPSQK